MREIFKKFIANEDGATAIEYGLIAALIAVVIITALTTIGTNLNTAFTSCRDVTALRFIEASSRCRHLVPGSQAQGQNASSGQRFHHVVAACQIMDRAT